MTPGPLHKFRDPVVAIAISILVSVFFLIGMAIFGFDKGVLASMSRTEFARGLITYLFAIVTIGTAVVLVVSALTGDGTERDKARFGQGKEVLSLLLGVFGTIVGYYFGAEVSTKGTTQEEILRLIPLRLSSAEVGAKEEFTLTTYVSGGRPPYFYGIALDDGTPEPKAAVPENGWIEVKLAAPDVSGQDVKIKLLVRDDDGHTTQTTTSIRVKP